MSNKFKIGDEVEVDFLPGQKFIITEIICHEIPHDKSRKIYNFKISNEQKQFEVQESEIIWTKSHITRCNRDKKLKELGI
jgi:hypothetical protein